MKTLVIALTVLNVTVASTRVFFFVKSPDGGAKFRLQCLSNPPANRCSVKDFKKSAKELCENNGFILSSLDPFSCVKNLQFGVETCKYANGNCIEKPVSKEKKEKIEEKLEEVSKPGIPSVEELPSIENLPEVETLPDAPSGERVKPIKEASELGPIKALPEQPLPEL